MVEKPALLELLNQARNPNTKVDHEEKFSKMKNPRKKIILDLKSKDKNERNKNRRRVNQNILRQKFDGCMVCLVCRSEYHQVLSMTTHLHNQPGWWRFQTLGMVRPRMVTLTDTDTRYDTRMVTFTDTDTRKDIRMDGHNQRGGG